MQENDRLTHIIRLAEEGRLGRGIRELENYFLANPRLGSDKESLSEILTDYNLMAEYWQRGYDDPKRQQVYDQLLRRLYVLASNMATKERLTGSRFWNSLYQRPRQSGRHWTMDDIRSQLEGFVSDVAMLQLEPDNLRKEKEAQLYASHQLLMHDLFDYILTTRLWSESLAQGFIDMLLSPTIDSLDQQLIVSAITVSAINTFGINRFRVLTTVCQKTTDKALRQRALVGWVLAMDSRKCTLYDEMQHMVNSVCVDQVVCNELTELQMQLIYCLQTEQDRRKIYNEIMPDIISNSNLKLTRQGLEEMEEDTLENILHPDAAENKMERLEQSMNRMMDMQKEGADIYFGGFSQMKRFPFYSDLSNWFVPFYAKHPGIHHIWTATKGKRFLQTLTKIGAFCDSDMYSLVLAFDQVLSHLPGNIVKLVEAGEAQPMPIGGDFSPEEQQQPAYVRRMYLQNLYRFYMLFPSRQEFVSPFDSPEHYAFFANPLIKHTSLVGRMTEVASFLIKHHRYDEALAVLDNCPEEKRGYEYLMLRGNLLMRLPQARPIEARNCFMQALELQPESEQALSGFARALFRCDDYAEAYKAYDKLLLRQPERRTYMQNAAICLTNLKRYEEALRLLYKLDYLYADDMNVKRVLAWVLCADGKFEQANTHYEQLLSQEKTLPADLLNYGYCLWLLGRIPQAIDQFRLFLNGQDDQQFSLAHEFMHTDHELLASHGISDVEIRMMLDSLEQ